MLDLAAIARWAAMFPAFILAWMIAGFDLMLGETV